MLRWPPPVFTMLSPTANLLAQRARNEPKLEESNKKP